MIFNVTGGGGAALNFKVVAYASEEALLAATPVENTIGIITETAITSYIFSAEEPSPATAGMVWIQTGSVSTVAFAATKKNPVMVYPLSVKQYVDGAWSTVTAMSYQGGEWVDWIIYLYNKGNDIDSLTGGWVNYNFYSNSYSKGTCENTDNGFELTIPGNQYAIARQTVDKIDLTEFNTIVFTLETVGTLDRTVVDLIVSEKSKHQVGDSSAANTRINEVISSNNPVSLDVSSLTGEYYVCVGKWSYENGSGTTRVISIELKR